MWKVSRLNNVTRINQMGSKAQFLPERRSVKAEHYRDN